MANRQVLTLKYRPQTFSELLIQDHVRETLARAIERNRLANAYLFAGPRGVGKTTTARILAKCLNCLESDRPTPTPCNRCSACVEIAESRSVDVLEIDGASSRGIDQIRELRENIRYAPSSLRTKVYIIDEVHMLTKEAFNALLKTLEEPPAHARFVFATTESHKVPLTIISRCQRFDFRKATVAEVATRLDWLAGKENIKIAPEAVAAIAVRAGGAVRDAESMLEQAAMYNPEGVHLSDVEELFGLVPDEMYFEYAGLLRDADQAGLLKLVDRVFETGYDFLEFYSGLVAHFRRLLLHHFQRSDAGLLAEEQARLGEQAAHFDRADLLRILDHLCRNEDQARRSQLPRVFLELVSLELAVGLKPGLCSPNPGPGAPDPEPGDTVKDAPAARPTAKVWQELRLRVNEHRPMLASLLELARPVSFADGVLSLSLPAKHKGSLEKIESGRPLIDRLLSEVTGSPARIDVAVVRTAPAPDPDIERLRSVFGEVEEDRK